MANWNDQFSGSSFQTEGLEMETITSGQTGSLLVKTAVAGKVYRIVMLLSGTASQQSGISLIVNGVTIEDTKTLVDNTSPSADVSTEFGVYRGYTSVNALANRGMYDVIECNSFEITKDAGNTTEAIWCSYEPGPYV